MVSTLPFNRQSIIGGIIFLFFLWSLSTFIPSTSSTTSTQITQEPGDQPNQVDGKPGSTPEYPSPDKSTPVLSPELSLPPGYEGEGDKTANKAPPTSAQGSQHTTSGDASKAESIGRPATGPNTPQSSSSPPALKDYGRALILYAFAESETARENLKFFINQGLHDAADFIFILNGETSVGAIIPQKNNIRVISRPNTCFDLGAYGEVLRKDDLYKKYKRFITLNASIRGPFLPHWAQSCWSDLYLGRLTDTVKLVGMTANCWPRFHVQSMIWATDEVGIELLLNPPPGSSTKDDFGTENDAVGMGGCYDGWNQAVHAEVGTTTIFLKQGYKVDLMMAAFQKSKNYIEECDTSQNGDVLWNGKYFGTNVHPYETIFIKANRDIDPTLIEHLTMWQQASGFNSYSVCKATS
ncbi:uncharacterized protein LY79DRAFT_536771 [Colletotrichum navitas]|uniref:Uncharacterized protein n=1 Tax=Colletotrichum navitas TaxID=681940 RepID=A0AAD8QCY5_9PEZI|nr:uncharacterized protein LY79DRAFT_536771 [Colletotrichum navitas]KAK1599053.1 hypothetical protein LY79DRAFT_536771 [Colletotrichum navitas]